MVKKVYLVENLDCANCASKVEAALNALPEVQEAVITYATMQLRITAEDPDALLPKLAGGRTEGGAGCGILPQRRRAHQPQRRA